MHKAQRACQLSKLDQQKKRKKPPKSQFHFCLLYKSGHLKVKEDNKIHNVLYRHYSVSTSVKSHGSNNF